MRLVATGVAILILGGCDHSEPFTGTSHGNDGPFSAVEPVRLTYSPQSDLEPAFSADGRWVLYVAERPGDQDRCLNVIPAGGGTWTHQLCAWELDQGTRKDGLAAPAMRSDGKLLFTRHSGSPIGITSQQMSLHLGHPDSVAASRLLMPLGERPAGATATWDDLLDPVWIGDDEVLALAVRRFLVNVPCNRSSGYCPWDDERTHDRDTIPLGVEIARLRVSETAVTVEQTIPAFEAIAWAHDASTDEVHYIVQRARPDDVDVYHEAFADTLFTVPLSGGAATPRLGTVGPLFSPMVRLHGVAAGGGRLYLSRSWNESGPDGSGRFPQGTSVRSEISEVMPDGTLRPIAFAPTTRWGRIRLSPDGRHLLAEAIARTTSDIYLIAVQP